MPSFGSSSRLKVLVCFIKHGSSLRLSPHCDLLGKSCFVGEALLRHLPNLSQSKPRVGETSARTTSLGAACGLASFCETGNYGNASDRTIDGCAIRLGRRSHPNSKASCRRGPSRPWGALGSSEVGKSRLARSRASAANMRSSRLTSGSSRRCLAVCAELGRR